MAGCCSVPQQQHWRLLHQRDLNLWRLHQNQFFHRLPQPCRRLFLTCQLMKMDRWLFLKHAHNYNNKLYISNLAIRRLHGLMKFVNTGDHWVWILYVMESYLSICRFCWIVQYGFGLTFHIVRWTLAMVLWRVLPICSSFRERMWQIQLTRCVRLSSPGRSWPAVAWPARSPTLFLV